MERVEVALDSLMALEERRPSRAVGGSRVQEDGMNPYIATKITKTPCTGNHPQYMP